METKQGQMRMMLRLLVFWAAGLVLAPAGWAGDLEPPEPVGPTMKTLDEVEPRIPISRFASC